MTGTNSSNERLILHQNVEINSNEYYLATFFFGNEIMDHVVRAGVKYLFVFANTNTNTNAAYLYLYLYLIKFQTMYLYLYLIYRIWCIWQIRFQIHFFPGLLSKHKFMEHKFTWIFFIKMLKSAILFQNKCGGLILLIPVGGCVCALDLACQWVCEKSLA